MQDSSESHLPHQDPLASEASPFEPPAADQTGPRPAKTWTEPIDRGEIPKSVVLALIAAFVVVGAQVFNAILGLHAPGGEIRLVIAIVVGGFVLLGMGQGHRLAWQWGRLLVLLLALLLTIYIALVIVTVGNNRHPDFAFRMVLFTITGPVAAWTVFFALGRPTALRFFLLVCPNCSSRRVRAASFLFNVAKCRDCQCRW